MVQKRMIFISFVVLLLLLTSSLITTNDGNIDGENEEELENDLIHLDAEEENVFVQITPESENEEPKSINEQQENSQDTNQQNSGPKVDSKSEEKIEFVRFSEVEKYPWLGMESLNSLHYTQRPVVLNNFMEEEEKERWRWEALKSYRTEVEINELKNRFKYFIYKDSPFSDLFQLNYSEEKRTIPFGDIYDLLNENSTKFYYGYIPLLALFSAEETEGIRFKEENSLQYHTYLVASNGTVISGFYEYADEFLEVLQGQVRVLLASPHDLDENMYLYPRLHPLRVHLQLNIYYIHYDKYPKARNINWYEVVVNAGEVLYIPTLWFREIQFQDHSQVVVYRRYSFGLELFNNLYNKIFPYPQVRSTAYQIQLARIYLKLLVDTLLGPGSLGYMVESIVLDRYHPIFDLSMSPDSFTTVFKDHFVVCDDTLQDAIDKFEWIQRTYGYHPLSLSEMKNNIEDVIQMFLPFLRDYEGSIRLLLKNFVEDYLANEGNPMQVPAFLTFCFNDIAAPFIADFNSQGFRRFEILTSQEYEQKMGTSD